MAEAIAECIARTIPTGVTLQLTDHEARVLTLILSKIGGDPRKSDRVTAEEILRVLMAAGYDFAALGTHKERASILCGGMAFHGYVPKRAA